MLAIVQQSLTRQYEASLCAIAQCVVQCPEDFWDTPIVRYPFNQVVYHALFFADYYLSSDPESFGKQEFHTDHPELFEGYEQLVDREPVLTYSREQIDGYLAHCRDKAVSVMAAETESSLSAESAFSCVSFSRVELHLYNIRHIQHHAAQLTLRLRAERGVDIAWVGTGWRELTSDNRLAN